MNEQAFYIKLTQFLKLLRKENKILINNQADKLDAIVAEKETFVDILNNYQGAITDQIRQAVAEIKQLQDENLLLTQMEMSYQTTLMNAVRESVKVANNPYGKAAVAKVPAATLLVDTDM